MLNLDIFFFSYFNNLMQYLPILISLFLQSPIGGQPRLLLSSSSRYSNGSAGPLTLSRPHHFQNPIAMKMDDFLIWKIESAIKSKSYLLRIHTIVMGIEHLRAEKGLVNSDEELSTHSTNKPLTKPNSRLGKSKFWGTNTR